MNQQRKVRFADLCENPSSLGDNFGEMSVAELEAVYGTKSAFSYMGEPNVVLKECMASCHALTKVAGRIIGDPLEVKMFESTKWTLLESSQGNYDGLVLAIVNSPEFDGSLKHKEASLTSPSNSIGIIKRFEFSSKLQRMSTVVRNLSNKTNLFRIHVKGSPEKIQQLSLKSTIPDNYKHVRAIRRRTHCLPTSI